MVLRVMLPKEKAAAVFEVLVSLDGKLAFVVRVDDEGDAEGVFESFCAVDMVEVGVGEKDGLNVGILGLIQDTLGLSGGVDDYALVGLGADDEVGVVFEVAGDYLPDLNIFVFVQYSHDVLQRLRGWGSRGGVWGRSLANGGWGCNEGEGWVAPIGTVIRDPRED